MSTESGVGSAGSQCPSVLAPARAHTTENLMKTLIAAMLAAACLVTFASTASAAETEEQSILNRGLISFNQPIRACWRGTSECQMFQTVIAGERNELIVLDIKDTPEGRAWCVSGGFITSPNPNCAWTPPLPTTAYKVRVLEKDCNLRGRNACSTLWKWVEGRPKANDGYE